MNTSESTRSFWRQVRSFPANFWYANVMETFERLAFYAVRAIAPLYLVASSGDNGLGLDYGQKAIIFSAWALLQCMVPMVSGGYTERYGYRKSLAVAFIINIFGYSGMALSKPIADHLTVQGWEGAGFWVYLVAASLVGIGTAIFKPPVHGTIAKTTDEETSSLGWGIFYWVVNIGGALGPMVAAVLRVEIDWDNVFYFAAAVTAANFLPAFLLYKEPEKTAPQESSLQSKGPVGVFLSSITTIFRDLRLVAFLGIFSCFWLMFMQLWDLLPNFIDEWVDSSDVAPLFAWFSEGWVLESGQTKPEMIINLDAIAIILLVIPISWLLGRISKIAAMIIGMLISLIGFVAAGSTSIGWFCCLMVLVFSVGEMACSPTFSAYVGLVAPKDRKALYMGYSNIPYAIGWVLGGLIGGFVYDGYGAKASVALQYLGARTELVAQAARAADWSDSLEKIPPLLNIGREEAFALVGSRLATEPERVTALLRDNFKYDRGQVDNLALQFVALHEKYRDKATERLARTLAEAPDEEERQLGAALAEGETRVEEIGLADLVHLLPGALRKSRAGAFDEVRKLLNDSVPPEQAKTDTEIVELLWQRFGDDPEVLNNLALEYLAQATDLVRDAVANMRFAHPPEKLDERIEEIKERIGIDRTKSFASLSAALGGKDNELDEILGSPGAPTLREDERLSVYLISQRQHRFAAVARKDWRNDRQLLREMVRTDPDVLQVACEGLADEGWFNSLFERVKGILGTDQDVGAVTEEGVNYHKLARRKDVLQRALAVKDWARAPDHAARLLGLNPFEARALASADFERAKEVLWNTHHPYMVWYYLGAVGLLGTVGMVLFYFVTRKRHSEGSVNAA